MIQPNFAHSLPQVFRKNKKRSYTSSILIGTLCCFFLFGFTYSSISNDKLSFSLFNSSADNNFGKISMSVNSSSLEGAEVAEAFLARMEQYDGVFSNNLNISLKDKNGNKGAISITDLKEQIGCLTEGKYYGMEHENADLNFYKDLGQMSFSNNSILILEGNNGNSIISRNGWINITSCSNGTLSGEFEFVIGESGNSISKGFFEDVNVQIEE